MAQQRYEEFRELANDSSKLPPPKKHWGILIMALVGVVVVGYLLFGQRKSETSVVEAVITGEEAAKVDLNNAEVVDAARDRNAVAREGYRYKVRVEDESSDGIAGVTHIGGLVVFVPNARPGDMAIVEVTRVKDRTADALVIRKIPEESIVITPRPARPREIRPPMFTPGQVCTSVVTEIGQKGDAITRVRGKVVFLPGGQPGDRVTFRIVEERDSAATGEILTREPGPVPTPAPRYDGRPAMTRPPMFQVGQVCTSVVTEIGQKGDAITRIDGKVVFLPGGQPGDRVTFRIVEERDSAATGEILTREPGPVPTPAPRYDDRPAMTKPPMFQVGQVCTSVVSEIGKKGDAITRIDGKVVFLPGGQPGDRVTFRIVDEHDSAATGEILTREPGPVPTPAPRYDDRPAMTKPPMFQVGQVCTSVVADIGKKGDAITRINGKVVFLAGGQPGERVVFRIIDERDSAATGEIISRMPAVSAPAPEPPVAPESALAPEPVVEPAAAPAEPVAAPVVEPVSVPAPVPVAAPVAAP